jgi:hypothetical protein
VDLGGMVLAVSDSWTAQVFHIVDQLADWSPYTHRAYLRWAGRALVLDSADQRLLQRHAELRRASNTPKAFDQAFLVEGGIAEAAAAAVTAGLLPAAEASAEREILEHFAPKLVGLREAQRSQVDGFLQRLATEGERLKPLVAQLARFAEATQRIDIPVFIVSNPDVNSGGGEANGGRLVIEVPSPDPMSALVHEAMHAFLAPHLDAIRAFADSAGVSFETLNEGIVYAMAPGLTDDPERRDMLGEQQARFQARGTPASNPYVQSYTMALVLRPLLRGALARGTTLSALLPAAVSRWKSVARP